MSGKTFFTAIQSTRIPSIRPTHIKDLVADMRAGQGWTCCSSSAEIPPTTLLPIRIRDALEEYQYSHSASSRPYQNETAELCQWHVNETHYLEAWGDARAYDGTVSVVQPLIAPLYDGKSACEFVAMLSGQSDATGHEIVQAYWQKQHPARTSIRFWRESLHDGWMEGTGFAPKQVGTSQKPALARQRPIDEAA